ncbi:MAG: TIGR00282 family metallophosphoesterase [Holosporales bacterium]|jgi:metallophosphoesterase (TIGR00282 family)|nr:TIGR00282 family metallophosphoesterase [Holosporales bacterium]
MRIAFFGDVMGKSGTDAVINYIQSNKTKYKFDFVVVNGENAAYGFGINQGICDQFFNAGVNVITLGNHTFARRDDIAIFEREKRLIRPLNYPKGTPGRGFVITDIPFLNKKIMIVNLMGRIFMEANDDPFSKIDELLNQYKLKVNVDAIFIDFHAEATAEKTALARYLDGRISAIIGTHTHVPTVDLQILQNGTGFLSDCGMCGDYDSCIGMDDKAPIRRFLSKVDAHAKMTPALKEATVCGVVVDINENGLCKDIQTIRVGGFLKEQKDYNPL